MIIRDFIKWILDKHPAVRETSLIDYYEEFKHDNRPEKLDWTLPSNTLNYYQHVAMETNMPQESCDLMLINAALGMAGEAGEFADLIKKWQFQGHPLDREHLAKELGDVLWYVAQGATALNMNLGTVGEMNLDKLEKRYEDRKFTVEQSINRKEGDI